MKKILSLLFLCNFLIQAQTNNDTSIPDIVPPSPMAYEMTRFEAQQPSLYTGTANISIPLYTIDFDGWQLPLSLSYNASGIKPIQEASEVGLGWALNSTAVISRTVRSGDDLAQTLSYDGYAYDSGNSLDVYNNWSSLTSSEKNSFKYDMRYGYSDLEPDVFNYNFFGFSGSFSLTKKSDAPVGTITVKKLNEDGVKIQFYEGIVNTYGDEYFTITTPTGYKGTFSIKERSTSLSGSFGDSPIGNLEYYSTYLAGGSIPGIEDLKKMGNFRTVTAWYLKNIVSPNDKQINFTYNINETSNSNYISISSPSFGETSPYSSGGITPYSSYSFSRTVQEHVYQTAISIPGEININFSMENRGDVQINDLFTGTGGFETTPASSLKRYNGLTVTGLNSNSSFSKQIDFEQSYFNLEYLHNYEALYEKYQMLRGRLDRVIIDDQKYELYYNSGLDGLPRKSTFGIDHQGYYNGQNASPFLSAVENGFIKRWKVECNYYNIRPDLRYYSYHNYRIPNIAYGISGSLNKIKYPTGGTTVYTYESPTFFTDGRNATNNSTRELDFVRPGNFSSGNAEAGGLRIKEIESFDENDSFVSKKTYQFQQAFSSNSSGKLMTPMAHMAALIDLTDYAPSWCFYMINYQKTMSGINTAQGAPIGYSRVVENTVSSSGTSYSQEYNFENIPTDLGDIKSVLSPKNYKNGKLVTEIGNKSSGGAVYNTTNDYQEVNHGDSKGLGLYVKIEPNGSSENVYYGFYPYETPIVSYNNTKTTQQTFLTGGGTLEQETNYIYDVLNQVKEQTSENSKGQVLKTVQKRIKDYTNTSCVNPTSGGGCMRTILMDDHNMVSKVLEKISYVDNQVVSATAYKYDVEHGNVVLRNIYTYDRSQGAFAASTNGFTFSNSYDLKITFNDYDTEGNVLQYTVEDGEPTSFIWGYENEYPIVKGEGISYSNLLTAHNYANGTSDYEYGIRNHSLTANAMIATFQFDPLTGMTKNTDAGGRSAYYTYDQYRRLKDVKDQNLKIVQSNEYNYLTQENTGSLSVNSNLSFGVVAPGTSRTEEVTVSNNSNYDITVDDLQLPQYFSSVWDNNPFIIRAGESFDLPVTFNSPSSAVNQVNGILTLVSASNLGGNLNVNLTATGAVESRVFLIPTSPIDYRCREITFSFGSTTVRIENSGNAPVLITSVSSNDNKINVSVPPSGFTVPPKSNGVNGYTLISVQLTASLNFGDNWDGNARLTFFTNATSSPNGAYVDIKTNCN